MRRILCAALVLLSACGGGGGGGSDPAPVNPPVSYSDAAERAAMSPPVFGTSIIQAVASDTISTRFTPGSSFEVTVARAGGSSFTLNTSGSSIIQNPETSSVTGRMSQTGTLVGSNVRAGVLVDWNSGDATDYLAGGYWSYRSSGGSVEIGAFVDGEEFSTSTQPTIPVNVGEVDYNGITGGTYVLGSATGEYRGSLFLEADFSTGAMTVDGDITNIELLQGGRYVLTPFVLQLIDASINADGSFTGSEVVLQNPQLGVANMGGRWGGRFSSEDDSDGNPRMVAGTHGGSATITNVGPVSFVGAFYGSTAAFKNSNSGATPPPGGCIDCPLPHE